MLESYAGEIASTLCAVIWALALTFFARAGRTVPPRALNVFKNLIVLPLMLATMLATGVEVVPDVDGQTWALIAFTALLGITVSDTLLFSSLNRVGAGWTAVVNCTYSPLVILVTAIGFGIPLTGSVALGSLVVGTAVVLAAGRLRTDVEGRALALGLAIGIAAQLTMAVGVALMKYPVFGRPALFDLTSLLTLTFWRMVIGTAALALWMVLRHDRAMALAHFRPNVSWRWMIPGSVLGSYAAMILWLYGIKMITGSLTRAAILNQTTAILLPLFGYLVLKERVTGRKLLAVGLAFVGACIVVLGR